MFAKSKPRPATASNVTNPALIRTKYAPRSCLFRIAMEASLDNGCVVEETCAGRADGAGSRRIAEDPGDRPDSVVANEGDSDDDHALRSIELSGHHTIRQDYALHGSRVGDLVSSAAVPRRIDTCRPGFRGVWRSSRGLLTKTLIHTYELSALRGPTLSMVGAKALTCCCASSRQRVTCSVRREEHSRKARFAASSLKACAILTVASSV